MSRQPWPSFDVVPSSHCQLIPPVHHNMYPGSLLRDSLPIQGLLCDIDFSRAVHNSIAELHLYLSVSPWCLGPSAGDWESGSTTLNPCCFISKPCQNTCNRLYCSELLAGTGVPRLGSQCPGLAKLGQKLETHWRGVIWILSSIIPIHGRERLRILICPSTNLAI